MDFRNDLDWSLEMAKQHTIPWYQQRFDSVEVVPENIQRRDDIDYYISSDGLQFTIEEKFKRPRWRPDRKLCDYFLIEELSNRDIQSLGWIYKTKADFMFWWFMVNDKPKKLNIFNMQSIRKCWFLMHDENMKIYREIPEHEYSKALCFEVKKSDPIWKVAFIDEEDF
jgi:hypothetical protein